MGIEPLSALHEAKHIGILQPGELREFVLALPMLQTLRKAAPDAHITFIGSDWHASFVEGRIDCIDGVIAMPGIVSFDEILSNHMVHLDTFLSQLEERYFDVIFQIHNGAIATNQFANMIAADLRVGFSGYMPNGLDVSLDDRGLFGGTLQYMELLMGLGQYCFEIAPHVRVRYGDMAALRNHFTRSYGKLLVVLHPGSVAALEYRWPVKRFIELAELLVQEGCMVVVVGALEEVPVIHDFMKGVSVPVKNLAGTLSLPALTALLDQADLVIGNDAGPLHLARALGTKSVGIYPLRSIRSSLPRFSLKERACMSALARCHRCTKISPDDSECSHEGALVEDITVEAVFRDVLSLL